MCGMIVRQTEKQLETILLDTAKVWHCIYEGPVVARNPFVTMATGLSARTYSLPPHC